MMCPRSACERIAAIVLLSNVVAARGGQAQTTMERTPGSVRLTLQEVSETYTLTNLASFSYCSEEPACMAALNMMLGVLDEGGANRAADVLSDAARPETVHKTRTATLSLTDLRMRMDVGDTTMIVRLADDGSGMDYVFLERGRLLMVVPLDQVGSGLPGLSAAARGPSSDFALSSACPSGSTCPRAGIALRQVGGTRDILGYPTQHWRLDWGGSSRPAAGPALVVERADDVWAANEGGAERAAAVIRAFYRNQVAVMGRVEGSTPGLVTALSMEQAVITDLGVPLLVTKADTIYVRQRDSSCGATAACGIPIVFRASTITVQPPGISTEPLDPTLFDVAGVPPPGGRQGCDCSCVGYRTFQRLGKVDPDEVRQHPEAMRILMCGRECVMQWMSCGSDGAEGCSGVEEVPDR